MLWPCSLTPSFVLELLGPFDPTTLKHVILSPDYKVLGTMLDSLSEMVQIDTTPADGTPFGFRGDRIGNIRS